MALLLPLVIYQQRMCFCPTTLGSAGLEDLVPKSIRRHNNDSIELEDETAIWPLWAPHASETGREGITVLAGVINPDYQGKLGCYYNDGKGEDVSNMGDLLGCLLGLL